MNRCDWWKFWFERDGESANKSAILIAFGVTFDCFECLDCILFVNIELHRSLIQFDLILIPVFCIKCCWSVDIWCLVSTNTARVGSWCCNLQLIFIIDIHCSQWTLIRPLKFLMNASKVGYSNNNQFRHAIFGFSILINNYILSTIYSYISCSSFAIFCLFWLSLNFFHSYFSVYSILIHPCHSNSFQSFISICIKWMIE